MRTTLTMDDDIAAQLRKAATNAGKSLETTVNIALCAGLAKGRIGKAVKPCRLMPVSMADAVGSHHLDEAPQLVDRLDDQEIVRSSAAGFNEASSR